MFEGQRVIAVTPAGRKAYLELLIPQLLEYHKEGVLDEYHMWVNTTVESDINYMESIEQKYPDFVRLRYLPDDKPCRGNMSIHWFFKECTAPDTIYVRFDDDIVYLDTVSAFKSFLKFRVENPHYFVVYGTILNNALIAHILQRFNKVDLKAGIAGYACMDEIGWRSGAFAANLHDQIIRRITSPDPEHLNEPLAHFRFEGEWMLYHNERVSINCLSWLGSEFNRACQGNVGWDEEQEIASDMPNRLGLMNTIFGGYCCVHYAFYTQREFVDKLGYVEKYTDLVKQKTMQGPIH